MEDESGKNKALGVPGLMLAAGRHVIEDVKGLQARAAPWRELVDHRAVSLPTGVYDGLARLRRNANDLGYNYFLILLALVATCLVMRPSLLLPIAGITALWLYVLRVRAADVVVGGRAFGLHAQRIALVAFAVVVLHFATNVSSVLFGALFLGGGFGRLRRLGSGRLRLRASRSGARPQKARPREPVKKAGQESSEALAVRAERERRRRRREAAERGAAPPAGKNQGMNHRTLFRETRRSRGTHQCGRGIAWNRDGLRRVR